MTSTGSGWRDGKGYAVSEREDESESWDFDVSIGASDFLGTIGLAERTTVCEEKLAEELDFDV